MQLAFRDPLIGNDEEFISGIDLQFVDWLGEQLGDPKMAAQMASACRWEYFPIQYYETEQRLMISVFHRTSGPNDAGLLLGWIENFLLHGLTLPPPKS